MNKTTKKEIQKVKKSTRQQFNDAYEDIWLRAFYNNWGLRKPTKKQLERQKKEEKDRKLREAKEEKRRAKKMNITVGEYEDAIEEARNYYEY